MPGAALDTSGFCGAVLMRRGFGDTRSLADFGIGQLLFPQLASPGLFGHEK